MSAPLVVACLWALAATIVAMLPMRRQYAPGLGLLIAAPALLVWIGVVHGAIYAVCGFAAFVSMFRRPLAHFMKWTVWRFREEPK
ncbi:hypothetical protein ROJ8625_02528 [Roseivivax jejudonensis]|uniref:UDP-N-acetylmuramate--alanine ligase n=1 Tax=Roseivivax jejudonensis TaxID=1529041 RepID=A0A1X6ZH96_9RHOB|nr:DUF2484 family protein [Roseivivax jejudonensis]SLN50859.1 hypothetical protein ROJ8625_02528 [Roseivivax jejudonensis]